MLDESWSSFRGIHGGYLTALAVHAAETRWMATRCGRSRRDFLRPAAIGGAVDARSHTREGRNVTTLAVTIEQEGTVAIAPSPRPRSEPGHDMGTCQAARPVPDRGMRTAVPARRRPPLRAGARSARPAWHSVQRRLRGADRWLRAPGRGEADRRGMAGDGPRIWFPPSAFVVHEPPTGGVSVDYPVHIHRTLSGLAPDEWLAARFVAPVSNAGLALEHGVVVGPPRRGVGRVVPHEVDGLTSPNLTSHRSTASMTTRGAIAR